MHRTADNNNGYDRVSHDTYHMFNRPAILGRNTLSKPKKKEKDKRKLS